MLSETVTEFHPGMPPAYLSNGCIGFRFAQDPTRPTHCGGNLISGFSLRRGDDHMVQRGLGIVPFPSLRMALNGEEATVTPLSQTMDFSCGELTTTLSLRSAHSSAEMVHRVFCSRTNPTLLCMCLTCRSKTALDMQVTVEYLTAGTDGAFDYIARQMPDNYDLCMRFRASDGGDSCGIAMRVLQEHASCNAAADACGAYDIVTVRLDGTHDAVLPVVTAYVPSSMHDEPEMQAHRELKLAAWDGFERIMTRNRAVWADLWRGRIYIDGDERAQDLADASLYYCLTSTHPCAPESPGPYGLSSEGYDGHAFWDCDSFIYPAVLMLQPDAARAMLEYRFERLGAAIKNARLNGYRGVQFPWQSGKTGCEVTPPQAGQAGGAGEQHINLDVAMAFVAYANIHGDDVFLRERAWPVLSGVADWIASRVEKTARGYEILHVTGIDEGTDNVGNDGYTAVLSKAVLRYAGDVAQAIGYHRPALWDEIASALIVPFDSTYGCLQQYEGVPVREQMASETLMAYFPYGYRRSPQEDASCYRFYLEHGLAHGLHLPMLSWFLGVFPAWLGERKIARAFYDYVPAHFVASPFWQNDECGRVAKTLENGETPYTVFLTSRGSHLCGLLLGLTRINLFAPSPDLRTEGPISLPEGWNSVTLGRIYLDGAPFRVVARQGAPRAELIPFTDNM